VFERIFLADEGKLIAGEVEKRPAGRGKDQTGNSPEIFTLKALQDCTVFAVNGEQSDVVFSHGGHDQLAANYKGLFIGKSDILPGLDCLQGGLKSCEPDEGANDHVHVGSCHHIEQTLLTDEDFGLAVDAAPE
jgi:hypothetical protein